MNSPGLPNLEPQFGRTTVQQESTARGVPETARRRLPRVLQVVGRYLYGVVLNLIEAARRWQRDDAGLLAGCVAYYATLSLFPLMLVLIAGLGALLEFTNIGHEAEMLVVEAIQQATNEMVATHVSTAFAQIKREALLGGPLGIAGLLIAALAVFSQFDRALDKIWSVEKPPFDGYLAVLWREASHRLKSFAVLLSMGLVVVIIFMTMMALSAVTKFSTERFPLAEGVWRFANCGVSVFLNTLVFTAVYRWLSKIHVGWLHAARGGLLAAITWEVGRLVLAAFLIGARYDAYGVVGSLLVAMLWIYYASSVLFLGAEYVQVIREQRHHDAFAQRVARLGADKNSAPAGLETQAQAAAKSSFDSWSGSFKKRAA